MDRCQKVACNHLLSDYPEDLSYDQLKELILDESDQVLVYCRYEDLSPEGLIQAIDGLADSIREHFPDLDGEAKAS